MQKQNLCKG